MDNNNQTALLEGETYYSINWIVDYVRKLKTTDLWMFQSYSLMLSKPNWFSLTPTKEKVLKEELLKLGWESQRVDYSTLCSSTSECVNCDGRHYYTKIVVWPANRLMFAKCFTGTCSSVILCCCFGGSIIRVM
jgi:hypothetical protein